MEIHLVRHTTPDVDKGICYGQSDILLKDSFNEEAKLVLQQMPSNAERIYSSPLTRCIKLAEKISQEHSLPITVDDRLKEMNFGAWEMQPWDAIDKISLMKWMDNYENERCPQGESYLDLVIRLKGFFLELKRKGHQSIIIVTHAGVIKSSHTILKGLSLKDSIALKIEYGSVLRILKSEWISESI